MGDGHLRSGRQTLGNVTQEGRDSSTPAAIHISHNAYQMPVQAPIPQQHRLEAAPANPSSVQNPNPHESIQNTDRLTSLNMGGMGGTLPDTGPQQHRFPPGGLTPAPAYQSSHFAGQTTSPYQNSRNYQTYAVQYPQQQQYSNIYQQVPPSGTAFHAYPQIVQSQHHSGGPAQLQQPWTGSAWVSQHQQQQYYYPMAAFGSQSQAHVFQAGPGSYSLPYARGLGLPMGANSVRRQESDFGGTNFNLSPQRVNSHGAGSLDEYVTGPPFLRPGSVSGMSRHGSTDSTTNPSMPRGPPRKPKQSGHALWVGNLPPATNVIDLKNHFSREATEDIESVFLISKSNCAFVNYRTERSCAAAMSRFHDSRFEGVRLVCRLRRSSASSVSGLATAPASASTHISQERLIPSLTRGDDVEPPLIVGQKVTTSSNEMPESNERSKEKFFIVKSLTIEDLELSVRNGIWATQTHNEASLNKAFQSAENVYLIFSANKSGEYFGYARMASPINGDGEDPIESTLEVTQAAPADSNHPRAIITPATEFAPKGRIIDDSARGTIFWEADAVTSQTPGSESRESEDTASLHSDHEGGLEPVTPGQAWGKPFKIEWIATNKLPFYRTRGLRNPWNANREVKIARDGTELETSVGKRLLELFHRTMPSPVGPTGPQQHSYQ